MSANISPSHTADVLALRQGIHDCTACPCRSEARLPVPPDVPLDPLPPHFRALVVGQNPGAEEDARNVPFVGRSGRLLNYWLEIAGLRRGFDTVVSNVVKCHTTDNRAPKFAEVETCKGLWLPREITMFRPQILIGFGAHVRDALGLDEFSSAVKHTPGKVALFVTLHPAAVLRNGKHKLRWERDAEVVRQWLEANPQT